MHHPLAWTLRPATVDDADTLAIVGAATFLDAYAGVVDGDGLLAHCREQHGAAAYRAHFAQGARAWIAEVEPGAAPVGYALTGAADLEQAGAGDRELKRIYVLSRFAGTGMAAALMEAAVADAKAAGHKRLLLGVKNDNHRALAFYARHGFATIGTRTFRVGSRTYDDFVLARDLQPELTDS